MSPRVLVAIDPGYAARGKGCAVAVFVDKTLASVAFERPESTSSDALALRVDEVVWECPQVDERTRHSAPACVKLAAVGGMLAGIYVGACGAKARTVLPTEWKGSVAKPVHHARVWRMLHDVERSLLGGDATLAVIEAAQRKGALDRWGLPGVRYYPSGWDTHNLLDAVALGVWAVGRS